MAAAKIFRCQIWQWLKHRPLLDDGRAVTRQFVSPVFHEELWNVSPANPQHRYAQAGILLAHLIASEECGEWLTTLAHHMVLNEKSLRDGKI